MSSLALQQDKGALERDFYLHRREQEYLIYINERTVQRWTRRHEERESLENEFRRVAPHRTTRKEISHHLLVATGRMNPLTTADTLKSQTGVNVGMQAVRIRLHEADPHHRTPATKPFLTETNREQRLGFALLYYTLRARRSVITSFSVTRKPSPQITTANFTAGVHAIPG